MSYCSAPCATHFSFSSLVRSSCACSNSCLSRICASCWSAISDRMVCNFTKSCKIDFKDVQVSFLRCFTRFFLHSTPLVPFLMRDCALLDCFPMLSRCGSDCYTAFSLSLLCDFLLVLLFSSRPLSLASLRPLR